MTAVRNRVEGYVDAWNSHDPDKVTSFFTPDASFATVWGMKACGTEGIREFSAKMLEALPKSLYLNSRSMNIRFVGGYRVAAIELSWELLQKRRTDHEEEIDLKSFPFKEGLALLVMCRERRKPQLIDPPWCIATIHHTNLTPPALIDFQNVLPTLS